jgi:hypothetical protein
MQKHCQVVHYLRTSGWGDHWSWGPLAGRSQQRMGLAAAPVRQSLQQAQTGLSVLLLCLLLLALVADCCLLRWAIPSVPAGTPPLAAAGQTGCWPASWLCFLLYLLLLLWGLGH